MSLINYNSTGTDYSPYVRAAGRYLRGAWRNYNKTPVGAQIVTKYDRQAAQLAYLQSRVARITPAVESVLITPSTFTATPNAATYWEYSITNNLVSNADMGVKYIGDKYRFLSLLCRMPFHESLSKVRLIVYSPKKTGDRIANNIDWQQIIDESKFNILHDTMLFPAHGNQSRKNFFIRNLKINRIVQSDRTAASTGTVMKNEIVVYALVQNDTALSLSSGFWFQAKIQNK